MTQFMPKPLLNSGMRHLLMMFALSVGGINCLTIPAIAQPSIDDIVKAAEADAKASEALAAEVAPSAGGSFVSMTVTLSLQKGKVQEAITQVMNYRKNYPQEPYSYSEMGKIKEEYLQDLAGAYKEYEQAIVIQKKALETTQRELAKATPLTQSNIEMQIELQKSIVADTANSAASVLLQIADTKQDTKAFGLAQTLMNFADTHEAKNFYTVINRARSAELDILYGKMPVPRVEKTTQAAQKLFDLAVAKRPQWTEPYLYRGIFKMRVLKDREGAAVDLKKAHALAKESGMQKGLLDRTVAALKSLENGTKTPDRPIQDKADTKTSASPLQEVQKLHFSQVSASARASYDRGLAKVNQDDAKGAIAEFDQALKAQPNYPEALNWRANVHRALGNNDQAMADFNQAIRLKPDYSRPYNNRGLLKNSQNDRQGAIADFTEAIRLEPSLGIPYRNRGTTLLAMGKSAEAVKDLRQAVKLAPTAGDFYDKLCEAELTEGNNQAGFNACDRAISLGFEESITYSNRGGARMGISDQKSGPLEFEPKAMADFDHAIKLNPKQPEPYYNRARLLLRRPDSKQAALRDFETALSLFKQQGKSQALIKDVEEEITSLKSPAKPKASNSKSDASKSDPSDFDKLFADFVEAFK